jgi:hypothetical protein
MLAPMELRKVSLRPPPNSPDEAKRLRLEPFKSGAVWWRSRAFPTTRTRTRERTGLMRTRTRARSYPARVGPDARRAHLAQSPLLASSGPTPNPQNPKKTTQDPPGSPQIRPRLHQASPRFLEDPSGSPRPRKPSPKIPPTPPKTANNHLEIVCFFLHSFPASFRRQFTKNHSGRGGIAKHFQ